MKRNAALKRIIGLVILLCLSIPVLRISAQDSAVQDILINYVETNDRIESLELYVYFTFLNDDGTAATNVNVKDATLYYQDEIVTPVLIEDDINRPIKVAMALDMSGSMRPHIDEMKKAAIDAINSAPTNAAFSIIKFDNRVDISGFMGPEAAIKHIEAIGMPSADAQTCLFDATYRAIEQVNNASSADPGSRRAVIAFTDGRDVKNVSDPSIPCSSFTFQQVVDTAQDLENRISRNLVPIYTIGMGNDVDPNLSQMARETGGIHVQTQSGSLSSAFDKIMEGLSNQWLGIVQVYPEERGEQSAILNLTLNDGKQIPAPFTFFSPRAYERPTNAQFELINVFAPSAEINNNRYLIEIESRGTDLAGEWEIRLMDTETGVEIGNALRLPATNNNKQTVIMDIANFPLAFETQYQVSVFARDKEGNLITKENGDSVTRALEFTHWADPGSLSVRLDDRIVFEYEAADGTNIDNVFLVNLIVEGSAEKIKSYEWSLLNADDNQSVEVVPTFITGTQYAIDMEQFSSGSEHFMRIRSLDEAGNVLSEFQTEKATTYNPPQLSALERLAAGIRDNLVILFAIFALIVFVILYLIWRSRTEDRKANPLPFLNFLGLEPKRSSVDAQLNVTNVYTGPQDNPASPVHQATLKITFTPSRMDTGTLIQITHFPFVIGRDGCDLNITGDQHITRQHVQLIEDQGSYYIIDLGSRNKTFVNGHEIRPKAPTPLNRTAEIRLGRRTTLQFQAH